MDRTTGDRILWRCRRGMKELDLLLERFAREHYPHAPASRQRAFERLLDLPDPVLAMLLLGPPALRNAPVCGPTDPSGMQEESGQAGAPLPPADRELGELAALVAAPGRR